MVLCSSPDNFVKEIQFSSRDMSVFSNENIRVSPLNPLWMVNLDKTRSDRISDQIFRILMCEM